MLTVLSLVWLLTALSLAWLLTALERVFAKAQRILAFKKAKSADVKSRLVLHTSASSLGLPGYDADAGAALEDGEAAFTGERAWL